ncbi:VOC family protein [bacterium]|nr:VOC family protein [bacterium]
MDSSRPADNPNPDLANTGVRSSPVFFVSDMQRSLDFYGRQMGFNVDDAYGDPVCWCNACLGTAVLMLSQPQRAVERTAAQVNDGYVWDAHIMVKDAQAYHNFIAANGVEILRPPSEAPYGMLEFVMRDPDGYSICFGQNL